MITSHENQELVIDLEWQSSVTLSFVLFPNTYFFHLHLLTLGLQTLRRAISSWKLSPARRAEFSCYGLRLDGRSSLFLTSSHMSFPVLKSLNLVMTSRSLAGDNVSPRAVLWGYRAKVLPAMASAHSIEKPYLCWG